MRILMRDEEDEADVYECAHEQADRDLGDPVLEESVEQARAEQRRDHRAKTRRLWKARVNRQAFRPVKSTPAFLTNFFMHVVKH